MPRLSKRIRKIASIPNQSHLDSEGFMCTRTSLKFFFAFIHKKEKKKYLVAEEIARCSFTLVFCKHFHFVANPGTLKKEFFAVFFRK